MTHISRSSPVQTSRPRYHRWFLALLTVLVVVGCSGQPAPSVTPQPPSATPTEPPATVAAQPSTTVPVVEPTVTASPTSAATPLPEPTLAATPSPSPSATPDPYAGLSIESLRATTFAGEGEIEIVETLASPPGFTRYLIRYPSDGLTIGGFMNVPAGEGPFPVVIVNHGYMPPESYETLTYTTKYADALAEAGFLTIHPNFRNHVGSDDGPNPFRIGYARDVLNLIPLAQRLPQSDGGKVGLWGHSMGGGISLRVLTLSDDVAAALLYGSMSGDEAKNYEAIMGWSGGRAAADGGLPTPPSDTALYAAISPLNYVEYIEAPIAIHHGVLDDQVPFEWSRELAARLDEANLLYEFYGYDDQNHNFTGEGYELLNRRTIEFFRDHLGSAESAP